jgi:hypothetical protein
MIKTRSKTMQKQEEMPGANSQSKTKSRMAMIGTYGLSTTTFPFLSDELCADLEYLTTAWADPIQVLRSPPATITHRKVPQDQRNMEVLTLQSVLYLNNPENIDYVLKNTNGRKRGPAKKTISKAGTSAAAGHKRASVQAEHQIAQTVKRPKK